MYKLGLMEIQSIYVAEGSVNDIIQATEVAYGHIFNLRAQLTAKAFTDFDS